MAFISLNSRVVEHRTRLVCLGETPSPRVRCQLAMFTYLLTTYKTFVLVLSDGYFDSQFCVKELRRATSLEKKIVLCHKQGVNVGAILQRKPPGPEFASIGDKQSLELVTSDAVYREFAVKRLIESAADGVAP